jgi:hypothetical protein
MIKNQMEGLVLGDDEFTEEEIRLIEVLTRVCPKYQWARPFVISVICGHKPGEMLGVVGMTAAMAAMLYTNLEVRASLLETKGALGA